MRSTVLLAMTLILTTAPDVPAASPDEAGIAFFEAKVRPVLVEHCYKCHSAQAETAGKLKGGLRLDSKNAILQGGDTGPSLEPGHADDSLLIQTLRYDDLIRMPPQGKLPDDVIADLTRWVNQGAPDPREDEALTPGAERPLQPGTGPRPLGVPTAPRDAPPGRPRYRLANQRRRSLPPRPPRRQRPPPRPRSQPRDPRPPTLFRPLRNAANPRGDPELRR